MQAVLLAAGLGSRLGALTEQIPKALIPSAASPLLAHAVAFARAAGRRRDHRSWAASASQVAAEVARLRAAGHLVENRAFATAT